MTQKEGKVTDSRPGNQIYVICLQINVFMLIAWIIRSKTLYKKKHTVEGKRTNKTIFVQLRGMAYFFFLFYDLLRESY